MTTNFETLFSKVLLRMPDKTTAIGLLAAKEAVNTAQKIIARVQDFDELIIMDTTNALTVAGQKTYHLENDLKLVRPKDILSIRLMAGDLSRKLKYYMPRELDDVLPYVETLSQDKSSAYTRRGNNLEFLPIPDAAYPLYIMHSQWPSELVEDTDETDFVDLDDVIVSLATLVAKDILGNQPDSRQQLSYEEFAKQLLGGAVSEDRHRPDQTLTMRPFNPYGNRRNPIHTEWWNDPFQKHNL